MTTQEIKFDCISYEEDLAYIPGLSQAAKILHFISPQLFLPFLLKNVVIIFVVVIGTYSVLFWASRTLGSRIQNGRAYDDIDLLSQDFLLLVQGSDIGGAQELNQVNSGEEQAKLLGTFTKQKSLYRDQLSNFY